MKTQNDHDWREVRWRRRLSAAEEARCRAWLAAHPEARSAWEEEEALSGLLEALPPVPVSSNFTARVLRQLEADEARSGRSAGAPAWPRWVWSVLPRWAWVGVVMLLLVVGVGQYRRLERGQLARDMTRFPAMAALPGAELWRDYDAIAEMALLSAQNRGVVTLATTPAGAAASVATVSDEELFTGLQ